MNRPRDRQRLAEAEDAARAIRARNMAVVIIAAFAGWMAANWLGGAWGLPVGVALAMDVICFGVLAWALYTLIGDWRARRGEGH